MKTVFVISLSVLLAGCSTITYKNAAGERASYTRIGSQNLSGVTINKTPDGITVKIENQRTSTEELASAITKVSEIAAGAVKK